MFKLTLRQAGREFNKNPQTLTLGYKKAIKSCKNFFKISLLPIEKHKIHNLQAIEKL